MRLNQADALYYSSISISCALVSYLNADFQKEIKRLEDSWSSEFQSFKNELAKRDVRILKLEDSWSKFQSLFLSLNNELAIRDVVILKQEDSWSSKFQSFNNELALRDVDILKLEERLRCVEHCVDNPLHNNHDD